MTTSRSWTLRQHMATKRSKPLLKITVGWPRLMSLVQQATQTAPASITISICVLRRRMIHPWPLWCLPAPTHWSQPMQIRVINWPLGRVLKVMLSPSIRRFFRWQAPLVIWPAKPWQQLDTAPSKKRDRPYHMIWIAESSLPSTANFIALLAHLVPMTTSLWPWGMEIPIPIANIKHGWTQILAQASIIVWKSMSGKMLPILHSICPF